MGAYGEIPTDTHARRTRFSMPLLRHICTEQQSPRVKAEGHLVPSITRRVGSHPSGTLNTWVCSLRPAQMDDSWRSERDSCQFRKKKKTVDKKQYRDYWNIFNTWQQGFSQQCQRWWTQTCLSSAHSCNCLNEMNNFPFQQPYHPHRRSRRTITGPNPSGHNTWRKKTSLPANTLKTGSTQRVG